MSLIRIVVCLCLAITAIEGQTIYNLSTTNQTFNYTTHSYNGVVADLPGVAFRFTAPSAGSYSIIVEDVESTSKYIMDYLTDQTFTTWDDYTGSSTGTMARSFSATSTGEVHYFSIYVGSNTTNNFRIRYATPITLTVTNDGRGTTSPSGNYSVTSGVAQTISASSTTGYRFSNWIVTSGSATIADPASYSTNVTITNNATVRANFTASVVYPISSTDQQYNFTTHFYQGVSPGSTPGVAFRFTAPAAGSYAIVVQDVQSSSKYLYDYGSSSTFSSASRSTSGTGTITLTFTAAAANEQHYFGVCPSSSSYYTNNFTIRFATTPTLTITNDGHGTTSPVSPLAVVSGVGQTITATPAAGYRFSSWTVTGGSATIANSAAYSTTVSITGDATILANFTQGIVNPIAASDQQYNFTTNYYQGTSPGNTPGVAFRFTAPAAGSYAIVVQDVQSSSKYLYDYGSSATFSTASRSTSGTGTITLTFTAAAANEQHYFGVCPSSSSYYTNNFTIRFATTPTLTITNDGHGTTSPVSPLAVVSGVGQTITATPAAGYRFSSWTVTSGSATIANPAAYSTTVSTTNDATILANFTQGVVNPIAATDQQYNFTTHYYQGTSPGNTPGVAFVFTAPAAGSYAIVVQDVQSSSKYLYDYGSSSTFSTASRSASGTGTITLTFTAATANEPHYFSVVPSSSSYYTNDFAIRFATTPTLTITNDGHGTTSPASPVAVVSGVAQTITATAATGYRFSNWMVISGAGNVTFANPAAYTTTATCTADATIQAIFTTGQTYPVTTTDASYNFTTHQYNGTSPSAGVAFLFTAPAAGSYIVTVADVQGSSKYLYYYGTNSSFTTVLSNTSGSGTITLMFTAQAANELHYLKVLPSGSSYWTNNFTIRYSTTPTLTVTSTGTGTTSPTGSVPVVAGASQSLTATPAMGYRFGSWTVTSGNSNITVGNTASYSTTATLTGNATVQAAFVAGTIHSITSTDVQYNYTTNYYSGVSPTSTGIAFKFTAPSSGGYTITLTDVETTDKYLYYVGTSPVFNSYVNYSAGTGTLTYSIYAVANSDHYFRVPPYSALSNNCKIRYSSTPSLTILTTAGGTTTPLNGTLVTSGSAVSINATPANSLYSFTRWEVVNGSVTIGSTTSASTTATVSSGSATIRAVFTQYPVDTLIVRTSGYGYTVPSDTVIFRDGYDTALTAYPGGASRFSSWTTISGTASIASPSSATTRISITNSKATVQANFVIDPNARPVINISDIDISGHPDICVTASVTDTLRRSILGLDASYFTLTEDGASLPFQLTSISNMGGTSVTLVIDKSGSMDGTPVTQAYQAALSYVATMGPLDRCAIVTFEDYATLRQTMTSDRNLLTGVINGLPTSGGGGTSILTGANLGIEQLLQETSSRSVIIFSDGNGTGTPSLDSVVNYARHNDVSFYSIGIGSAQAYPLQNLADSTGGYFVTAPSAAQLEQIYAQIRRDVEARYILCYQTPDLVFNGDNHRVVVSTTLNSRTARDTTYWNESNQPPLITLTAATVALMGASQPVNTPLTITADITDDGTISNARLFYRQSGTTNSYTEIPMTLQTGTTYRAIVPAGLVQTPGVDFYILATDNYHLIGRSPNTSNPAAQPWVIPVNNQLPAIVHTVPGCVQTPVNSAIDAVITDANGIRSATLFYKRSNDVLYTSVAMTATGSNNYRATIPAAGFGPGGSDYYLQAFDNLGVAGRSPQSANHTLPLCFNAPPVANAGADRTVSAGSSCDATIALNGSNSRDPDGGTIMSYTWTGTFSGSLTGATPNVTLPAGIHPIVLVVVDDEGSNGRDTVIVTVVDDQAPVAPTIAPLTGECSVSVTTIPTAVDQCSGVVQGRTASPLVYSTLGTHTVVWTFTDAAGNTASRNQTVNVTDNTAPVPEVATLPNATGECSVTLPAPRATDNCSGVLTGTTPVPVFSTQGTFNVVWTYIDGAGNRTTQPQAVVVHDATPPVITAKSDTAISISGLATGKYVRLTPAAATDNCLPVNITARRTDGLHLDSLYPIGSTEVWWKACDDNVNCDSIRQQVIVRRNRIPTISVLSDTTIDEGTLLRIRVAAFDTDGVAPRLAASNLPAGAVFTDSGNGAGSFVWNTGCSSNGVYSLVFTASDGFDSVKAYTGLTVRNLNFAPRFLMMNDTAAPENREFILPIRAEDCDGEIPKLRAVSIPAGSSFKDNGNGTATLLWTPDCDNNGFYIVVFEATDDHTAVRDTMIIRITDVNCFTPQMTLSAADLTSGVNLPLSVTVHATDRDGGIPLLEVSGLPGGARFTPDGNGSAVLSWTPAVRGTFRTVITAVDDAETAVRVDTTVIFRITEENFTGPSFRPCSDTIISENQQLLLSVVAEDPDHTTPSLSGLSLPPGATFVDLGNGSGRFSWIPGCTMHGSYYLTARATDGTLSDTLSVLVVVRDQNCPPVINPVTDKNIAFGSTLRFSVSAVDPDGDVTPDLSVACALPGYTFTIPERGHGTFEWNASYASGTYPVTFFATDGEMSDTEAVAISVNKSGTLRIVTDPPSASIFSSPAPSFPGTLIGTGSATITGVPGTFWFGAQAPGYRQSTFTGTITSDVTCTLAVALRPQIPLMFAAAESVTIGTSTDPGVAGSVAFVDFDGDGRQDLSIAGGRQITIFTGSDSAGVMYRKPGISINVPAAVDSIVAHTYADWNNDGSYECILATAGGKVRCAAFDNEDLGAGDVIVERADETLFPLVADIDHDGKKDLVVTSRGKGVYLYLNSGTDQAPSFGTPVTVSDASAAPVSGLSGSPMLTDVDGDGLADLIVGGGGNLRIFARSGDSTLRQLPAGEDLNTGGVRVGMGSGTSCALLMVPRQMPRLAVFGSGRINLYRLRLLGDITADGVVDIADISKIARGWELTDKDPAWNPVCNIKLSPSGGEVVDIKDISKASKSWELRE